MSMLWKRASVLMVLLFALAIFAGCGTDPVVDPGPDPDPDDPVGPIQGGVLNVGWVGEPNTIDLHKSGQAAAFRLMLAIHEPLTWMTPDGQVVPGLVLDWDVSDDGLTYRMRLKEGVMFHDGTPFNAEALKFNFDRIKNPATAAQSALGFLGSYESSEVVEEFVIDVHFAAAFSPWPRMMSSAGLAPVSPTAVQAMGDDAFSLAPVGAGPFMVDRWEAGSALYLKRFEDYNWASEFHDHSGPAYLDELVFHFIPEAQVRYSSLLTGELQVIDGVPEFHMADLEANPDFEVVMQPTPGISVHAWINCQQWPTDDVLVRRAINYAYDSQGMIDVVMGGVALPPGGPLAKGNWGHTDEFSTTYYYDPDKAVALLEEAGWTEVGADGIRVKDGERLVISMNVQSPSYIQDVAEFLQEDMAQVGIHLQLDVMASSAWSAANYEGKQNLTAGGVWRTDPDLLRLAFCYENGVFNWGFFENEELSRLVLEGVEAIGDDRLPIYAEIQSILTEYAPTLPLFDPVTRFAHTVEVDGILWEENSTALFYGAHFVGR